MCYTSNCEWALIQADLDWFYIKVPIMPNGSLLCRSTDGTGINARTETVRDANGKAYTHHFFGAAEWGPCFPRVRVRD